MATARPVVVSPPGTVGERCGVELVLVSVEACRDEVAVRRRGRPSDRTPVLEARFHAELERWHPEGKGDPPRQPAEDVFDLDASLSDDLGTRYTPAGSARGGSASMFRVQARAARERPRDRCPSQRRRHRRPPRLRAWRLKVTISRGR